NTQVNSKYYGKLASSSPQRVNRKRSRVVRAAAIAGVAGGPRRAIFRSPLGLRRFFSKRSCFSSSKMRTGESCLVVLSFELASAWVSADRYVLSRRVQNNEQTKK